MKGEVWREVDGQAIRCNGCPENHMQELYANDEIVGVEYTCEAKDGICIYLHKPIASQEWYEDFHEIYHKEDQQG